MIHTKGAWGSSFGSSAIPDPAQDREEPCYFGMPTGVACPECGGELRYAHSDQHGVGLLVCNERACHGSCGFQKEVRDKQMARTLDHYTQLIPGSSESNAKLISKVLGKPCAVHHYIGPLRAGGRT